MSTALSCTRRGRRTPILITLIGIAACFLAGCGGEKTQSAMPVSIKCPPGHAAHAAGKFAMANVTFVCISEELAANPDLLRCDRTSGPPMICEDRGEFYFSRGADGLVYAGDRPTATLEGDLKEYKGSYMGVIFQAGPPRNPTFEEVDNQWVSVLEGGANALPKGFKRVKGPLCQRHASALNHGACNLEAESASLYWHFAVYFPRREGQEIADEEYLKELDFWLAYIGPLVVDPAS